MRFRGSICYFMSTSNYRRPAWVAKHRRRSGWTSGGTHGEHGERRRWVCVEWGGIWGGCPLSSRPRGLGERCKLPSGVRGGAPAENGFLKAAERSFLYLYDKIWEGTICISVPPAPNSGGGDLSPCPPVIYAHVAKAFLAAFYIVFVTMCLYICLYMYCGK